MPRRIYLAAYTLDPESPQYAHPQVVLAASVADAIEAGTVALRVTPNQIVDVTGQLVNELGALIELARVQRKAADGSRVFRDSQRDVVRRWLGEDVTQVCTSCGQAVTDHSPPAATP